MKLLELIKDLFKKRRYARVQIIDNNSVTKPMKDTITIVKKNNKFSWAKFYCPCGCGSEITLSLNSNIKPYWSINVKKQKITLSPSVHLIGFPCRAHFFIIDNKVKWV